ncbi:ATP-binding protein, partial [Streptomyces sp. 196(2019)]|nr:ATP-binding protein [Streptomyces sp. 196(2019)]
WTFGEAELERGRHRAAPASPSPADGGAPKAPPRTAAQQFGAFQRGRRPQADPAAPDGPAAPPPGAP